MGVQLGKFYSQLLHLVSEWHDDDGDHEGTWDLHGILWEEPLWSSRINVENVVNGAEIDRKPHSGNCSDERWQENHERQRSSQWNAGNSSFNSW